MNYFTKIIIILSLLVLLFISCNNPLDSSTGNGKVVFVSNEDYKLYTQNLDGSNRKRIHIQNVEETITPILLGNINDETIMNRSDPRWSPDGTRIALVVDVAMDQSQLIVMDADGGNAKTASPDPQMVWCPDWSPDGTKIAYALATSLWGTMTEIVITDLETDTWQQLTNMSMQVGNLIYPRWSEDGEKIFFTNSAYPDSLRNIYKYNFESDTVNIIGAWSAISAFARDGNRVYGSKDNNIFRYSMEDHTEKILTSDQFVDQDPRLIDFDQQIIFTHNKSQYNSELGEWFFDYEVWLMTENGDDSRKVENSDEFIGANHIDIFWE